MLPESTAQSSTVSWWQSEGEEERPSRAVNDGDNDEEDASFFARVEEEECGEDTRVAEFANAWAEAEATAEREEERRGGAVGNMEVSALKEQVGLSR